MTLFRPAILYVDDEQANLDTFRRAFGADYLVKTALSAIEALTILESEDFPLVIADQKMPEMTGIELCERLISLQPAAIRMILTAYTETQILLDAINRGHVHDYIVKPWRKSELKPVIEKAFDTYREKTAKLKELEARIGRAEQLDSEIRQIYDADRIIGVSSGLQRVWETLKKAAPTDSTILLLGETGTGKELLARAIHDNSKRKDSSFVAVHCAALTPTLLESELFGHEEGAFTGAGEARRGRFEAAQGGTIFLDEIGEISGEVQVKLLRVLQEREIQRVGGNRTIAVDVRVIAATNRNLKGDVDSGRFRADLFFRLNVIPVTVPPLRERAADIPDLASHFLETFNRQVGRSLVFKKETLGELVRHDWPGNVRELKNLIERVVILSPGPEIEPDDLKLAINEGVSVTSVDLAKIGSEKVPAGNTLRSEIQKEEMQKLTQALRATRGNISEAARNLGIARSTLFHRLKKAGLI